MDGQRCLTKDGYAKLTAKYDDNGRRLEQVEFDVTGKSTVKKYDRGGREIEEAYFDEKHNPTTNKMVSRGGLRNFPKDANPADMTYFDRDGKPIAVQIYVVEVLPGGQAKEVGLMEGDVLVSYDGKAIRNDAEFTGLVRTPGNTPRELVVSRSGLRLTFKMKPGLMGVLTNARAAPTVAKIQ